MESFATHFSAFLFLASVGIRRLLCSFSLFLNNPSQYRSKTWYFSELKWKNVDFYTLLVALPLASFSHIFFFLAVSGQPTYRFSFLQQSLVIFLFWAFLVLMIVKKNWDLYTVPETFVFILGGIAFLAEYWMNGRGIVGLGAVGYELLGGLTLVCSGCCLYLSLVPSAFFAEFLLSSVLLLKGTWVLQLGLTLYTDAFSIEGCKKIGVIRDRGKADVQCELEEDKLRGMALLNFLFTGHAIVVLITSFVFYGLLHRHKSIRYGEASGPLLAQIGSEGPMINQLPELEIE